MSFGSRSTEHMETDLCSMCSRKVKASSSRLSIQKEPERTHTKAHIHLQQRPLQIQPQRGVWLGDPSHSYTDMELLREPLCLLHKISTFRGDMCASQRAMWKELLTLIQKRRQSEGQNCSWTRLPTPLPPTTKTADTYQSHVRTRP